VPWTKFFRPDGLCGEPVALDAHAPPGDDLPDPPNQRVAAFQGLHAKAQRREGEHERGPENEIARSGAALINGDRRITPVSDPLRLCVFA
jgi:hypothetical protein